MPVNYYSSNPMLPTRTLKNDCLALEIIRLSERLRGAFQTNTAESMADFIAVISAYYSNQLEGEALNPKELDAATRGEISTDDESFLSKSFHHAEFKTRQKLRDYLKDDSINIASPNFLKWIHKEFYNSLPYELRIIKNSAGFACGEVIPGEFRNQHSPNAKHQIPPYESIGHLMEQFKEGFTDLAHNQDCQTLAIGAAAHYQICSINPFEIGNRRIARLFSYAWHIRTETDSNGLWSLSFALYQDKENYFKNLAAAKKSDDQSDEAGKDENSDPLNTFILFYLRSVRNHVYFMNQLLESTSFLNRLKEFCSIQTAEKKIPKESYRILENIFYKGRISRGQVPELLNCSPRKSTSLIKKLGDQNLLKSESEKGPLEMKITSYSAPWIFPHLFPTSSPIPEDNS